MVLLLVAATVGSQPVPDQGPNLLTSVVRALQADSVSGALFVDPRPLRADPDLATLHRDFPRLSGLLPQNVSAEPFEPIASAELGARVSLLRSLGADTASVYRYAACPGLMQPPADSLAALRERDCPRTTLRIAAIAPARPGGARFPGREAGTEATSTEYRTVRAIIRQYGPNGQYETAVDFVFHRPGDGTWVLREKITVMWVE